jgi:hypothetical protein
LLSLTLREETAVASRIAAARRFQALVRSRNNLLHSRPGTGPGGTACLMRDGDGWTIDEIEAIGAAFEDCAVELAA